MKQITRREMLKMMGTTTAATLLAACTQAKVEPTPTVEVATPTPSQPVDIALWTFTYQPFVDGLNALVKDFNNSQKTVNVTAQVFDWGNYWDKIAAAVAAGKGPDIFQGSDNLMGPYICNNVLQPIPDTDIPFGSMPKWISQNKLLDKFWYVPLGVRTWAYVYNPDIYKKHPGLKPPTTWDEEITVAEQLVEHDDKGNITVVGEGVYPDWDEVSKWINKSYQAGGSFSTADFKTVTWTDPGCVEAFKFLTSKVTQHKFFVDGFMNGWVDAQSNGAMAGMFANSGCLGTYITFKTPFASSPMTMGPKNNASCVSCFPLVLTQQAKGPNYGAAIQFLKYVATPNATRIWCRIAQDVPTFVEVQKEDEFYKSPLGTFIDEMDNAVNVFYPDALSIAPFFTDAWNRVVKDGIDPEAALKEAQPKVQAVYDEFWKNLGNL